MKKCSKCKVEKPIEEFGIDKHRKDRRNPWCRKCVNEAGQKYRKANPDRRREATKRWRDANIEKHHEINKKWAKANPEKTRQKAKKYRETYPDRVKAADKKWRENNPEKYKIVYSRAYQKRYISLKGKLNICMANAIGQSLRGNKNGHHWEDLVGYTLNDLKKHLEKQFQSNMNWENYGKWHIDHIIPISAFNFNKPEHIDFKRCWNLSNLRPLWRLENISKGNKLTKPFQPSLDLTVGE